VAHRVAGRPSTSAHNPDPATAIFKTGHWARKQAKHHPSVLSIVMTVVGSKGQVKATPDQASRMYIERAIAICEQYPNLFGHNDPSDAFVLTDDVHSAGRSRILPA
jgi:hypothetical protein